jgi:ZIP family zinc transporter
MSDTQIALLGAIAGATIFLGLPIGRLNNPAPRLRALLNASAAGILLFLLWDVLAHAWEPVDAALGTHHYGTAVGDGLVLAVGLGIGLLGLVYFDRWVARRHNRSTRALVSVGGAVAGGIEPAPPRGGTEPAPVPGKPAVAGAPARTLALLIATGIGLHNFAEGMAIGNSAATGEIALAILLIIAFGLHNATEGFGIVAPLAAAGIRPSWGYLGVLGLIGGGPTFLGTLVGQRFTNETISIAFLALAAGSILYVVIELLAVARRMNVKEITTWGIFLGLVAGFATDAIVSAAGA